jgi:hypothetical protein
MLTGPLATAKTLERSGFCLSSADKLPAWISAAAVHRPQSITLLPFF